MIETTMSVGLHHDIWEWVCRTWTWIRTLHVFRKRELVQRVSDNWLKEKIYTHRERDDHGNCD